MKINSIVIAVILCFIGSYTSAQLKPIKGKIIASGDVEGIHILNKTALKYTVTDANGSFEILAKVLDSLTISSLKYKQKTIIVSKAEIDIGLIQITLEERINELDEVILGRLFTGNLESDLKNTETKNALNFYDLGIPGYIGKLPTLAERRLLADVHVGGGRSLTGIIHDINGQTKYFKQLEELEKKIICIKKFKDKFSKSIFENERLADSLKIQYFDYASDDPNFNTICRGNGTLSQLEFLLKKLKDFKIQINTEDED